MKNLSSLFFAGILLAGCGTGKVISAVSGDNRLSDLEKSQGWQLLFDGNTLANWHTYGGTGIGNAWKVENGAIHLDPAAKRSGNTGGGDLVTNNEYGNFDFEYDWKISPKGNSGVMFYVNEDPARFKATYESGPEMQILDTKGHPDGKIIKHWAGDLYDLISSTPNTNAVGEWNKAEIVSKNGKLDFYLNGLKTLSTTMWDDNWKNLIANSKFKAWPGFGTFTKGRFALQDHGDEVWFKNIKVKNL